MRMWIFIIGVAMGLSIPVVECKPATNILRDYYKSASDASPSQGLQSTYPKQGLPAPPAPRQPRGCLYWKSPTDHHEVMYVHGQMTFDHKVCNNGKIVGQHKPENRQGNIVQVFENVGRIIFGNLAKKYSLKAKEMTSKNF